MSQKAEGSSEVYYWIDNWSDILNEAYLCNVHLVEKLNKLIPKLNGSVPAKYFLRMGEDLQMVILKSFNFDESTVSAIFQACKAATSDCVVNMRKRRLNVEKVAPSPSQCATEIHRMRYMFSHRPITSGSLPVILKCKVFADFVNAQLSEPELRFIKPAVELMIAMSRFYETERLHVQAFREVMEKIGISMLGLDFGKFCTDGTSMYSNQAVCNFEFKN